MSTLINFLEYMEKLMWGGPLLLLFSVVGIYLTIALKGIQFRYLFYSLKLAFSRHDDKAQGDISQFQSLMTALAATIGIGSITGIATGLVFGGLGSLFWMWVTALFGMATKYAEAILAIKYRVVDKKNEMCGGPMYYLENGMKMKWLGVSFAAIGVVASFALGNIVQAHSISDAMLDYFSVKPYLTGIVIAILTAITLFGGIKSIGKVSSVLVPVMGVFFILGGLLVLLLRIQLIPSAIQCIFKEAFSFKAASGGVLGSGVMLAMQYGVSRGVFSSEAGMGSSPIAAAAAKTDVPGRQALISMSSVFIASFIVCTISGLAIAVSGILGSLNPDGSVLNGSALAVRSFNNILPGGGFIVTVSIILFGYSTILGWAYYGEKCLEYLLGEKAVKWYRIIFILVLVAGSVMTLRLVWSFANIMNGLMSIPNLIGLFALATVVAKETKGFEKLIRKERASNDK